MVDESETRIGPIRPGAVPPISGSRRLRSPGDQTVTGVEETAGQRPRPGKTVVQTDTVTSGQNRQTRSRAVTRMGRYVAGKLRLRLETVEGLGLPRSR